MAVKKKASSHNKKLETSVGNSPEQVKENPVEILPASRRSAIKQLREANAELSTVKAQIKQVKIATSLGNPRENLLSKQRLLKIKITALNKFLQAHKLKRKPVVAQKKAGSDVPVFTAKMAQDKEHKGENLPKLSLVPKELLDNFIGSRHLPKNLPIPYLTRKKRLDAAKEELLIAKESLPKAQVNAIGDNDYYKKADRIEKLVLEIGNLDQYSKKYDTKRVESAQKQGKLDEIEEANYIIATYTNFLNSNSSERRPRSPLGSSGVSARIEALTVYVQKLQGEITDIDKQVSATLVPPLNTDVKPKIESFVNASLNGLFGFNFDIVASENVSPEAKDGELKITTISQGEKKVLNKAEVYRGTKTWKNKTSVVSRLGFLGLDLLILLPLKLLTLNLLPINFQTPEISDTQSIATVEQDHKGDVTYKSSDKLTTEQKRETAYAMAMVFLKDHKNGEKIKINIENKEGQQPSKEAKEMAGMVHAALLALRPELAKQINNISLLKEEQPYILKKQASARSEAPDYLIKDKGFLGLKDDEGFRGLGRKILGKDGNEEVMLKRRTEYLTLREQLKDLRSSPKKSLLNNTNELTSTPKPPK